jgi:cyclophilin family peptidyl-prolyl cis-trans isomerase
MLGRSFAVARCGAPPVRGVRLFSGDGAKRARGPRNTKNYDWYFRAVEKLAQTERALLPAECFPKEVGSRSRAFMELERGGEALGRLTFVLCDDLLPKTCENFKLLCEGHSELKYEGTIIHRIARDQVLMGGDVEMLEGRGGHSALGTKYFKDEAFVGLHNSPGILSMINGGIDTNNSQFFVTLQPQRQLNGRNVAFGYLESGKEVLEKCATTFTFRQRPLTKLVVSKAGIL